MGDLEALNEGAITASRQVPHDAAAAVAAGGTAGVYRLRLGEPLAAPKFAHWFAKPPGVSYTALLEWLGPVTAGCTGALWMRQMTLGPAAEFCLHAPESVTLEPGLTSLTIALRSVWPVDV